jgi:hypothetical protein
LDEVADVWAVPILMGRGEGESGESSEDSIIFCYVGDGTGPGKDGIENMW